jgi:repressor LexA
MIYMTLGQLVANYRQEHNLSLQDFANLIGTSKGYVHILEKDYNPATGKPVKAGVTTLTNIANVMGMDLTSLLDIIGTDSSKEDDEGEYFAILKRKRTIPVLGSVIAGIPIEAIEDIVDYEEIGEDILKTGSEFFGLKVKGDSMSPTLIAGDTIIVRKQEDCENGDIAVVLVNGNEATVKKVLKKETGIMLQPINPAYEPLSFTNKEINKLPVKIIGTVVELRRKNLL